MSWKKNLQLLDFDGDNPLEARCTRCGYTWYEIPSDYTQRPEILQLFIDEYESRLTCKQWNCKGVIRLSQTHSGETEGFQGGLS